MIIYYSGHGTHKGWPEMILGPAANLMATYHDFQRRNKPNKRLRRILKSRKRKVYVEPSTFRGK